MIAGEGWPWLIIVAIGGLLIGWYWEPIWASPAAVLYILLFLLFRDPMRSIPPMPLAVVAPVDGWIVDIATDVSGILQGEWTRVSIKTNHFGAYTVRSPIEGAILNVVEQVAPTDLNESPRGLWVRSEEQDNVVLLFPRLGRRRGPKTFVRYGERVGQGQRFAYLRLAPCAEVYLPVSAVVRVQEHAYVHAGTSVLADLAPK
ncbi:MAG: hypothetical protein QF483_09445 [Gammaproteobacteria bacterium]|jgi:phosphatidylserine decarboxylase|nr:hypothetical protein [Chromatiales bacterium]MCP4924781.1 hypothetical protein [Gammaproteobacteria bacterium]MDP7296634.1 hypothetical protein [Gammaproteobacteria bacterium]MDP7420095.1 hypothetical protein [Gammaproteobacteria bacterium]MDP7659913.1 hypothetical protein [Gammaproteobacteria bacterium]